MSPATFFGILSGLNVVSFRNHILTSRTSSQCKNISTHAPHFGKGNRRILDFVCVVLSACVVWMPRWGSWNYALDLFYTRKCFSWYWNVSCKTGIYISQWTISGVVREIVLCVSLQNSLQFTKQNLQQPGLVCFWFLAARQKAKQPLSVALPSSLSLLLSLDSQTPKTAAYMAARPWRW